MRKLVLCLLFAAVATLLNAAKVYYLNPTTDLVEFIDGLKSYTNDNVIINLSEGTYYLKKTLRFNVEHRVPIKIVGHGNVVISGASPLTDWEVMSEGCWRTKQTVNYNIQQLIVNGVLATRAKTPNDGVFYLQGGSLIMRKGDDVVYKAVLPESLVKELKAIKKTEKPVVNLLRLFTHSKTIVESFNTKELSLSFTERYVQPYFTPAESTGIFLENYLAALDAPGEWYQDEMGFVYYLPREGEMINKVKISYAKLYNLATISGVPEHLAGNVTFSNIVFEGCDVLGSDIGIPPYQSAYTLDAAVFAICAKNVNFIDCEFRGLGGYALWIMSNCEDCKIDGNYIHDIGGGGIKVGGLNIKPEFVSTNIEVSNNIIQRFGRIYMGATGIFLTYAHHCTISHNDISDGYYTGISAGFSWGYGESPTHNNIITYNRISNLGQGLLNDMAGIYTLGVSPGTAISYNLISDVKSSYGDSFGIYTDEGSSDILIENNTAYNCTGGGFHQHYGSNNIVRNNIFAYGEKANLLISSVKKPEDIQLIFERNIVMISKGDAMSGDALKIGKFIFKDNCFYEVNGKELAVNGEPLESWMKSRGFTIKVDNPRLRNPEKGDFRFRSRRLARMIGFKGIKTSKVGANWQP